MTSHTAEAADAVVRAAIACGRDEAGAVMGTVGVSGDTSDKDEVCAIAGIKSAGLIADPAEPAAGWDKSRL